MSNANSLDELVPPLPGKRRWQMLAGMLLLAVLLPVAAATGLARPNVATLAGGGEWNQETGVGSLFMVVQNRGIVPVTVSSVDSEWTDFELDDPIQIPAKGESRVEVGYTMSCDQAVSHEEILDDGTSARTRLHIRGMGPIALDYAVDQVVDALLPTPDMCRPTSS